MRVVAFVHGPDCAECQEALETMRVHNIGGEVHHLLRNGDLVCELLARLGRPLPIPLRLPQIFLIEGNVQKYIGDTQDLRQYVLRETSLSV